MNNMKIISFEKIDNNLKECWEFYKDYVEDFKKNHYSDEIPEDFISWCEDNLTICPGCSEIVLQDDITLDTFNTDEVCETCIENDYYGRE